MVAISGVGHALPTKVVENSHFESLGVSDEWIRTRTGIESRRWLSENESLASLAVKASRMALEHSGLLPSDINFVMAATSTPDDYAPGIAPLVAAELGLGEVGALDFSVACSGFLYALEVASARIRLGDSKAVLVIGADAMSRLLDPEDPKSAPLFGDGAGAVVVSGGEEGSIPKFSFGSDGTRAGYLEVKRSTGKLSMDGRDVYSFAIEKMSGAVLQVLEQDKLASQDVAFLVCHQANERITQAVVRQLNWPAGRYASYIASIGNTSAASIPISLSLAESEGRIHHNELVGLAAFGSGYNWGAGLIKWGIPSREETHAI